MNFLRIFLYITDTPLHSLDFLSVVHQQHMCMYDCWLLLPCEGSDVLVMQHCVMWQVQRSALLLPVACLISWNLAKRIFVVARILYLMKLTACLTWALNRRLERSLSKFE